MFQKYKNSINLIINFFLLLVMLGIILAVIISFIVYCYFKEQNIIQITPPVEAMKNVTYRCNNKIYKLRKKTHVQ